MPENTFNLEQFVVAVTEKNISGLVQGITEARAVYSEMRDALPDPKPTTRKFEPYSHGVDSVSSMEEAQRKAIQFAEGFSRTTTRTPAYGDSGKAIVIATGDYLTNMQMFARVLQLKINQEAATAAGKSVFDNNDPFGTFPEEEEEEPTEG